MSEERKLTDEELRQWAEDQRRAYHEGRLSPEKVQRLESLPDWTWDEAEKQKNRTNE